MKNNGLECFTHNVMWLRKCNGLSKKEMAKIMGIGVESLNKIENGELPPKMSVEAVFNIQQHFRISPKSLFGQRLK